MLELKNIVKEYYTEDETVQALKGVSLRFRDSEFVSILGPSGCGKTTMLNIVGGLDRYTSGDLIINGKSTKDYTDKDWDTYRNHSVGFVFQSYNLIPHQTVLENVELALTLSGIGKEERKKRAIAVLEKVGLGNKINSRPNQLSGGQMQRVAIARALINDPEILLADEPTGALDSKTSVQIMELLKEISNDRLIIMVTHNPEIAESYSTRIIKMLDGEIVEDPNPVTDEEIQNTKKVERHTNKGKDKTQMSFKTALSLSLKNLLTKKTRTLLVSFAGSIGIIGIALILSLSSGFQGYINQVQQDTLSTYPLVIQSTTADMSSVLDSFSGRADGMEAFPTDGNIKADKSFSQLMDAYGNSQVSNNLTDLKDYLEQGNFDNTKISAIQYSYNISFVVHGTDVYGKPNKELYTAFEKLMSLNFGNSGSSGGTGVGNMASSFMNFDAWSEAIDNEELIRSQYDIVGGNWADFGKADEVMLVLDQYNQIPDYILPALGLMDVDELVYPVMEAYEKTMGVPAGSITDLLGIKKVEPTNKQITVHDVIGKEFNITLPHEQFVMTAPADGDKPATYMFDDTKISNRKVKIVGVVRPKEGAAGGALNTTLVYGKALTDQLLSSIENSELIATQKANPTIDITTGELFVANQTSLISNLTRFGDINTDMPETISLYAATFEDKDYIVSIIDGYNADKPDGEKIVYNDYLGAMMSSVTDIINAISYVLIGFVSVSLIVSSIMIGIITYISVLERIKEIGILRALGASKRDVSRVFNAETLIIGFAAGAIGILVTVILNIPISLIIHALAGISNVARLPWVGGVCLVIISMALTLIAGIIPSRIASKKDPVIALRSE